MTARLQDQIARMAELVDALVSNTSSSDTVRVQVPLRVLKKERE